MEMHFRLFLVILVALLALQGCSGQLFPFSTLRHYIDQRYAESVTEEVTNAPPPVDTYRYLQETTQGQTLPPSFGTSAIQELRNKRGEIRTVVVTPKPKYTPQRLVPEPEVDPSNSQVPSIGLTVGGVRPSKDLYVSSTSKPVELASLPPPSFSPPQPVLLPSSFTLKKEDGLTGTVVESVPSLSVTIHDGFNNLGRSGLIDYLTPPKYPSVYENHGKSSENQHSVSPKDTPKQSGGVPKLKKKKIKNRRQKNDSKEPDRSPSTEKRIRLRPRLNAPLQKFQQLPIIKDLVDSQSSATENYFREPPPNHKFQDEYAAETSIGDSNIGLGPTGERVEFQLHGQNGPETYKFGFDTGDGKNRHFRYEEKDNHGNVKGHYGYYDKTGKLQVVNYLADKHGFHANPA